MYKNARKKCYMLEIKSVQFGLDNENTVTVKKNFICDNTLFEAGNCSVWIFRPNDFDWKVWDSEEELLGFFSNMLS